MYRVPYMGVAFALALWLTRSIWVARSTTWVSKSGMHGNRITDPLKKFRQRQTVAPPESNRRITFLCR